MAAGEHDDRGDREPDYRFTLANERTFLAWQCTALGVLAAGVAVVQFAPEFVVPSARHAIGVVLAALAVLTAGGGLHRWRQVDRAIRRGHPLPPSGGWLSPRPARRRCWRIAPRPLRRVGPARR